MSAKSWKMRPIGEPWVAFLTDLDRALESPVTIHCIGGFALSTLVDMPRPTGDIDFIEVLPEHGRAQLLSVGDKDSNLAEKHSLFLQDVGIADAPYDYENRLIDVTPAGLDRLGLRVLDPYDLILTKAQRGVTKDIEDARLLVEQLSLDKDVLWDRFEKKLWPYLAVAPEKTKLTVRIWLEELFE